MLKKIRLLKKVLYFCNLIYNILEPVKLDDKKNNFTDLNKKGYVIKIYLINFTLDVAK